MPFSTNSLQEDFLMSINIKKRRHPPCRVIGGRSFGATTAYPHLDSNRCVAFDSSQLGKIKGQSCCWTVPTNATILQQQVWSISSGGRPRLLTFLRYFMDLLIINNVSRFYEINDNKKYALKQFSYTFPTSGFFGVVGKSGSGK